MTTIREHSSDYFGAILVCFVYLSFFYLIGIAFVAYSEDLKTHYNVNMTDELLYNTPTYNSRPLPTNKFGIVDFGVQHVVRSVLKNHTTRTFVVEAEIKNLMM